MHRNYNKHIWMKIVKNGERIVTSFEQRQDDLYGKCIEYVKDELIY